MHVVIVSFVFLMERYGRISKCWFVEARVRNSGADVNGLVGNFVTMFCS